MSSSLSIANNQQLQQMDEFLGDSCRFQQQRPSSAIRQSSADQYGHIKRRIPSGNPNPFLIDTSKELGQQSFAAPYVVHRKLLRRRHIALIQKRKDNALIRAQNNRSSRSVSERQQQLVAFSSEGRDLDSRRSREIRQTIRPRNLAASRSFEDKISQQKQIDSAELAEDQKRPQDIIESSREYNKRQKIGNICLTFSPVRIRPLAGVVRSLSATA